MVEFVKDVHVLYGGKLRCMNNEGLLVSKGSKDCMPFGLFHKRKGNAQWENIKFKSKVPFSSISHKFSSWKIKDREINSFPKNRNFN